MKRALRIGLVLVAVLGAIAIALVAFGTNIRAIFGASTSALSGQVTPPAPADGKKGKGDERVRLGIIGSGGLEKGSGEEEKDPIAPHKQ
jgi:hypothetical protein